jgi:hypothetical protein
MSDARPLRGALTLLIVVMTTGAVHPQPVDPLEPIRRLVFVARYADAEAAARARLSEVEATIGPESLAASEVMDLLVEALWRGGKVRAAETRSLAERAVAVKEKVLGANDPGVGFSLTNLGNVLRMRGDFAAAREQFDRALAVLERAVGTSYSPMDHSTVTSGTMLSSPAPAWPLPD